MPKGQAILISSIPRVQRMPASRSFQYKVSDFSANSGHPWFFHCRPPPVTVARVRHLRFSHEAERMASCMSVAVRRSRCLQLRSNWSIPDQRTRTVT